MIEIQYLGVIERLRPEDIISTNEAVCNLCRNQFMKDLREHLLWLLKGGRAHISFEEAVADMPTEAMGQIPVHGPHSPWQLLEHLRIAQWDILEFSRDEKHVSPRFPDGYWPAAVGPPEERAWHNSIAKFHHDREEFGALISDPKQELLSPLPWGDGQTLLREALLIADHNAYHIGQLIEVRRALGAWPA